MFHRSQVVQVLLLLALSFTLPSESWGQQLQGTSRARQAVRGYLLDLEAVAPVSAGDMTLLSGDQRLAAASTDEAGFFFLPVQEPGTYQLEARRLGYATTLSQPFQVTSGDTVTVRFGVHPQAVPIEPLLVVGRTSRGVNKFTEHMEEWGKGIFLTPELLDSIAPRHYGDVFRKQEDIWLSWGWGTLSSGSSGPIPRVRTYRGQGCMTYMVNRTPIIPGNRYILEGLDPETIVAVEIYRYPGEVPPDLRNFEDINTASVRMSGTPQLGRYAGAGWSDPFSGSTTSGIEYLECGIAVYWTTEEW